MSFLAAVLLALGDPSAAPTAPPAASPAVVLNAPMQEASQPIASYAERERAATDLETFRGGSEGLLVLIVVVVAVLVLLAILIPW